MLKISKALKSQQLEEYHKNEYVSDSQNYWNQGNAIQGKWAGSLAETMGVSGPIQEEHFRRLSQGQNPLTGEQMIRHRNQAAYTNKEGEIVTPTEHRAGWDATFSAPKSISLTALVGGDERIREAHRQAVQTALSELERYTQARMGGNNPAKTTGKFVAATFEHDTARPVNGYGAPQLHTHAVIFNVTELEDGRKRSIQPHSLYQTQQFATAVYQAELMRRVKDLGYEITTGKSGAPEIAGYKQEYLDSSSPRRQQIVEALARSGHSGAKAAEIAAHNTREKKQILTSEEVLAAHMQLSAEHGHQAQRVVAEAAARKRTLRPEIIDKNKRLQEAIAYAKDRNFEREAVVDQRALLRDAMRREMGNFSYAQVRDAFHKNINQGELIEIEGKDGDSSRRFTTPQIIAAEKANVRIMQDGQGSVKPIMSAQEAKNHASKWEFLNQTQSTVLQEVLTSEDKVHGLQGYAGTGKTTTLKAIREGAEEKGYIVQGFAPTHKASKELAKAGIASMTLQSFLARANSQEDPTATHLYLLDESSLTSTTQMQTFLKKLRANDRVLLIGDVRQHQGVDAGKPFEQMQQAGMQTSQLDQIVRQKDPELREAVRLLSNNETAKGLAMLQEQGRVVQVENKEERIQAIAKDYASNPAGTLVVSPDNQSRRQINEAIRSELQKEGVLSSKNHEFSILIQRNELTNVDRTWAWNYRPNDVLLYSKGSKKIGIEQGSYATVVATDVDANTITVRRKDGSEVTYDPKRLRGINAYTENPINLAQGEKIQFTTNDKQLGVSNRDLGVVKTIDGNNVTVMLDGNESKTVTFDASRMRHFDHGYAVTSHSSQGLTTSRVLVHVDSATNSALLNTRFAYVSISRAEHDARIYTDSTEELGGVLSNEETKTSAVNFSGSERSDRRPPSSETEIQINEENLILPQNNHGLVHVESYNRSTNVNQYSLMPESIYTHHLPESQIRADIRETQKYLSQGKDASEVALNLSARYFQQNGGYFLSGKVEIRYAEKLVESVSQHPERTMEQHIDSLRPTREERQRWEGFVYKVGVVEATKYEWIRQTGNIQTFQHEITKNYIHIDQDGEFYSRNTQNISQEQKINNSNQMNTQFTFQRMQANKNELEIS